MFKKIERNRLAVLANDAEILAKDFIERDTRERSAIAEYLKVKIGELPNTDIAPRMDNYLFVGVTGTHVIFVDAPDYETAQFLRLPLDWVLVNPNKYFKALHYHLRGTRDPIPKEPEYTIEEWKKQVFDNKVTCGFEQWVVWMQNQ
jgi:hypothetical protein